MIAKSEADVDYARSLKDDVLKMCIGASDTNKIKLSEVKDQFKTIPLHILGIVMEVLCGDNALIANAMGRMTLYSVPQERLKEKQIVAIKDICEKGKQLKDKENVIPKGMQIAKKSVQPVGKKRKELSIQDGDDDSSVSHSHVNHSSARPPIAKKTKTSAAKKSKPETAAESSTNQHEPKKSQQVVLSAANRSLMTYSPGPLNQEAQKD
eukprot:gene34290-45996_t